MSPCRGRASGGFFLISRGLRIAGGLLTLFAFVAQAEDNIEPPQVLKKVTPDYPASLAFSGDSGRVVLDCQLDDRGEIKDINVIGSSHPDFEAPAVEAVFQWKFRPAMRKGMPVAARQRVTITFVNENGTGGQTWQIDRVASSKVPPPFQYNEPPRPILTSAPVYPYDLLVQKIEGSVTIDFCIDPNGHPQRIWATKSSRPEFAAAAIAMIAAWEFRPAKKDGTPCWAFLQKEQKFNRSDRDTCVSDSALRLLKELQQSPCPILKSTKDLDGPLTPHFRPAPAIPPTLAADGVAAEASIVFIVDHAGHAQLPRILKATRDDFGWAAAAAVGRWQFSVPLKNGKPADVIAMIPLRYKPLPKPGGSPSS